MCRVPVFGIFLGPPVSHGMLKYHRRRIPNRLSLYYQPDRIPANCQATTTHRVDPETEVLSNRLRHQIQY